MVSNLNTAAINAAVTGDTTRNREFRVVSYLGTTYTTPLTYFNAVTISITTFVPLPANLNIVNCLPNPINLFFFKIQYLFIYHIKGDEIFNKVSDKLSKMPIISIIYMVSLKAFDKNSLHNRHKITPFYQPLK